MQIHIRRGSETYGPYNLAEIRTYLGQGQLEPQDQARTDDMGSWQPLADLLGQLAARGDALDPNEARDLKSAAAFSAPPAPLPETSALSAAPAYMPGDPGWRFLAYVVDNLISLACVLPGLGLWMVNGLHNPGQGVFLLLLAGIVAAIGYSFVKDGLDGGASLGKRMTGLMVVHLSTNEPCTMGQSSLRSLIGFLLNIVPYIGWLVEPIMVLAATDRRRLGDRAANTQVIRVTDYRP